MLRLREPLSFVRSLLRAPLLVLLLAGVFGARAGNAVPAPAASSSALIYAGWYGNTIPTPSFVKANIAFLETQPFDGLVVYLRNPALTINATTGVMTGTPLSYDAISSVMAPLLTTPFVKLSQNLGLIQGSTPPDFFDDWSITTQNFANVARAARDAGLKGLCFDNEQYFSPWAAYSRQKYYPAKSLAEYQTQARLRGKQAMAAMVAQFPGIAVLTLHGPYVSEPKAPASLEFPQWQTSNELLGPFFAGFMESVGSSALNTDGGELYTLRTATQFQGSYNWRKNTLPSDTVNCAFIPPADRPTWPALSCISFGVYDLPFGGADMNPTLLRSTLANALRQADRYVWFYAEGSTYLLPPSQGGATATWVDAIRQARIDAVSGTPPLAPSNLSASAVSAAQINLAWTDGSTNESGFQVERKTGTAGTWSLVASPGANAVSFGDTGLAAGTTYVYRLRAVNSWGSSSYCNEAGTTTAPPPNPQPPAAPSNLAASAVSTSQINLTWTDGSTNESGFQVERKTGAAGTWSLIASPGSSAVSFSDTGLAAGTPYVYRVWAVNSAGSSSFSNEAGATTAPALQPPAAPANLTAVVTPTGAVRLTWTDTSSNEAQFEIQRKTGRWGRWNPYATVGAGTTSYLDAAVNSGGTYSYRIRAVNAAGASSFTKQDRVTIP